MPIQGTSSNPSYVSPSVPNLKDIYSSYGWDYDKRGDLSGTSSFLSNYWLQQQQNAYELDLWKMKNEYDSPLSQMTRYQMAGLNPNLIYSQQNTSGATSSSAPIASKPTNFKAQNALQSLQMFSQLMRSAVDVMQAGRDMYAFKKYGETYAELRNNIAQSESQIAATQANTVQAVNQVEQAKAAALSYYYGNGVPFGSPYWRLLSSDIKAKSLLPSQIAAQTGVSQKQAQLLGVQIPYWVTAEDKAAAEAAYTRGKTNLLPWELEMMKARIDNLVADTQNKQYFHDMIYPYQSTNVQYENTMRKIQAGLLGLTYQGMYYANPWLQNPNTSDATKFMLGRLSNFLNFNAGDILGMFKFKY